MARHIYQGVAQDGNGRVISTATITPYLAGTTTAVDVYAASSGGSAVNSVTSDSYGAFTFYVDDTEYTPTHKFKIVISKTSYTSSTWDNLEIIPEETYRYYVDPTATDQGAATTRGDRSVKDFVDTIGATKNGTLIFAHNAAANTTTYTFTTAEVISDNITCIVESGAILSLAGTLTIGPIQAGNYRVFDGDISNLTFSAQQEINVTWGGGVPDGSTDQTTDIDNLLSACPEGSTIIWPTFTNEWVGNFTIPKDGLKLKGMGPHKTQVIPNSDATPVFEFEGDRCHLLNFHINGNGAEVTAYGVRIDRTASGQAAGGFIVDNCRIQNVTHGVYILANYYGTVRYCKIEDVTYGILGRDPCNNNRFDHIKFSDADYGIALLNVAGTDTHVSHGNVISSCAFEGLNTGGIGVQLWNVNDNKIENNYFEGTDWPVIEAGGPIKVVHNGGDATAYLTDSKGRDFVKMGVAVGDTVYNRTNDESGAILSIGDDAATNDKLTITLSGAETFDDDDFCVIDLDNTTACVLRNEFQNNTFSVVGDLQSFFDGITHLAKVQGSYAFKQDGTTFTSKWSNQAVATDTITEIDVSSNYSAFTTRPLCKMLCAVRIDNDSASACFANFLPAGSDASTDSYVRVDLLASGQYSGMLEIPLDSDFKVSYICDNATHVWIRIYGFLH